MYFDLATMTISEIGGHGDCDLPADEFARDDRTKRVDTAANSLCDWVFEHLMETAGNGEWGNMGIFKQEHLPRIERMLAVAMMAQFEHDLKMEGELVAELLKDDKASEQAAKDVAP
jgi:hypothetical protein